MKRVVTHVPALALALLFAVPGCTLTERGCQPHGHHGHHGHHGPERWSAEWYATEAESPVGARQVYRLGKLWPPFPRPVGKKQQFSHQFHAAHYWPYPYVCLDRQYVRTVSGQEVINGWIAEATLYDYHFDPDSHMLNPAGRSHLQWIVESAPPDRRFAWVQSTSDPEISQARLANVHSEAVLVAGEENLPAIALRGGSPNGRPATEIDKLRQKELSTMPEPRIRYRPLPTSGSGG